MYKYVTSNNTYPGHGKMYATMQSNPTKDLINRPD